MSFQADIIEVLDNGIKARCFCGDVFADAVYYGIAYDATRNDVMNNEKAVSRVQYPVTQTLLGSCVDITVNNKIPLQVYHRVLNRTYSTDIKASFGESNNGQKVVTNVKMIVAGWTDKLGLYAEDLELILTSNFPDAISSGIPAGLKRLAFVLATTNFDKEQVWKGEYRGIPYDAKPTQILFSVLYSIEATFQKGCYKLSDCDAVLPYYN